MPYGHGKEKLEQTGKKHTIEGVTFAARKKTGNKWFETQDQIGYWDDFSKQKIVWKRIGSILRFAYDDEGCLGLDSTCIAVGKHAKFVTAYLNSLIGNYMLSDSPKTGTGDLLISVQAIEPILIPKAAVSVCMPIIDSIMKSTKLSGNAKDNEEDLDRTLFEYFGFTNVESEHITAVAEILRR